ncbi:MAG: ribonuclease Z [Spirochaetota bacterium]
MQTIVLGYSGGIQTAESSNTSLVVTSDSTSLLVDCSGSPCQALLSHSIDPDHVDGVLLTHAHVDHLYGLPSLLHNLWLRGRRKKLPILGSAATLETAKALCGVFRLDKKQALRDILVWSDSIRRIGDIEIEAFSVFHRPLVPTQGYVFTQGAEKISFFPDSAAQEPYPECARGSSLLIHEAGGLDVSRELLNGEGHSSALDAARLAAALEAKELLLVHLPPGRGLQAEMLAEARSIFPASRLP